MIPSGVILPFNGNHASIPSGWTRETNLDSLFPKAWGASVAPGTTGGANTHTHTSSAHGHTPVSHQHSVRLNFLADSPQVVDEGGGQLTGSHEHNSSDTSATTGGTIANDTTTWSSVNQEPPYYTVIFIKPTGSMAFVTTNILAYFNRLSNPSGWKFCDGNAGAPDLRSKYLKGASTGANAGTTGGATTHNHSLTHNHTATSHTHTGTSGASIDGYVRLGGSGSDWAVSSHTHPISLNATTFSVDNYTNTTAGSSDTVEPAYKKMALFTHSGGGVIKGLIGMWLGATSGIPIGWKLCDGNNGTIDLRDKFVKCGTDITENGNTGGSNTHQHSSVNHTHTSPAHTHSGSDSASSTKGWKNGNGYHGLHAWDHTHGLGTVSSVAVTMSTDAISCSSVNNEPAYKTVAYIEFQFAAGGSFLLNVV